MQKPRLDYDPGLSARQDRFSSIPEMVAQRAFVRAALALRPGERVLEVGCGNGWLACEMARDVGEEGRVVGADISPVMVSMAQALCGREGQGNVEFVTADATDLPFPDGSFDVAAVVQCFCLVADVEAAIAELFRVLRPAGRAIVLDTDWDTLAWNSADPALMNEMASLYTAVYSDSHLPRRLPELLHAAGFQLSDRTEFPIANRTYERESFAAYQIDFTRAVADGIVPAARLDAWVASIEATVQTASYFFRLSRSVFKVEKLADDNSKLMRQHRG